MTWTNAWNGEETRTNVFLCVYVKPDGTYNMPDSSIVLQGATAQLTGRQQDTFDIVLVFISIHWFTKHTHAL